MGSNPGGITKREKEQKAQKQGTIRKRSRDEQREDEVRKGRENGEERKIWPGLRERV